MKRRTAHLTRVLALHAPLFAYPPSQPRRADALWRPPLPSIHRPPPGTGAAEWSGLAAHMGKQTEGQSHCLVAAHPQPQCANEPLPAANGCHSRARAARVGMGPPRAGGEISSPWDCDQTRAAPPPPPPPHHPTPNRDTLSGPPSLVRRWTSPAAAAGPPALISLQLQRAAARCTNLVLRRPAGPPACSLAVRVTPRRRKATRQSCGTRVAVMTRWGGGRASLPPSVGGGPARCAQRGGCWGGGGERGTHIGQRGPHSRACAASRTARRPG